MMRYLRFIASLYGLYRPPSVAEIKAKAAKQLFEKRDFHSREARMARQQHERLMASAAGLNALASHHAMNAQASEAAALGM